MNELSQGLEVSLLGMIITFSALGVFVLIMVVLKRLFPYKNDGAAESEVAVSTEPVEIAVKTELVDEESEVAAAVGAALAYWMSRSRSSLGDSLQEGRSGWWASHQVDAQLGKPQKR